MKDEVLLLCQINILFTKKLERVVLVKILNIYVACALTYASEDFKKQIEILKEEIRNIDGVNLFDFMGVISGTPQDVYKHDIHHCVENANLIIAEVSEPSTGLGWELGKAVESQKGTYVLALARENVKVTRLVIGAVDPKRNPRYFFKIYNTFEELVSFCKEEIEDKKIIFNIHN